MTSSPCPRCETKDLQADAVASLQPGTQLVQYGHQLSALLRTSNQSYESCGKDVRKLGERRGERVAVLHPVSEFRNHLIAQSRRRRASINQSIQGVDERHSGVDEHAELLAKNRQSARVAAKLLGFIAGEQSLQS